MSLFQLVKKLLSDTRPPKPDDILRIRTFTNISEASIAKNWLENNGIPSIIENEGEMYTPQVKDGIGLMIFYRDWDKASALLSNMK